MPKQNIDREILRKLGWPLAMALVVLFVGLLVLIPRIKEIFYLRAENDKQKKKLVVLETKAEIIESLLTSNLKERLEFTFKALPAENNLPLFFNTLEQIAARHSLELREFSTSKSASSNGSFKCLVAGQRGNLETFFTELDHVLPLLAVQEIKLENDGESLKASFVLKSFTLAVEDKIELPEEVNLLNDKEEKVLQELADFTSVDFPAVLPSPSAGGGRQDPFSF